MFVYLLAPGAEEENLHTTASRPSQPSLRNNNDPSQLDGGTTTIPAMEPIPEAFRVNQEPAVVVASTEEEAKEIDTSGEDAKKLEDAISDAVADLDDAEEEELLANQSMLSQTVKKMEDVFKFGLGKLFGNSVDDEEMAKIANEVSERLEEEVQDEFRKKADELADKKVEEIEDIVELDEDAKINSKAIRSDVKQAEELGVDDLKEEIDDAAKDINAGIEEKALEIEKEVVNQYLAKKGIRVEVKDGELKKDGDDDPSDDADVTSKQKETENTAAVVGQEDVTHGDKTDENTTAVVTPEEKTMDENATVVVLQSEIMEGENLTEVVTQRVEEAKDEDTTQVVTPVEEIGGENVTEVVAPVEETGGENATEVDTPVEETQVENAAVAIEANNTETHDTEGEEVAPEEKTAEEIGQGDANEGEEEEEIEAQAANEALAGTEKEEETDKA